MYSLYCERTIRNGNTVIRLANAAPAPKATNNAGNAQHINVDDDANKDKKLADLSFILYILRTFIPVAFCPFARIFFLMSLKSISTPFE